VWVGHTARDDGQRLGEFSSSEMRSEAVMNAATEGKHGRRALAGDVKAVRVLVDVWVAVGAVLMITRVPAGIYTPASSASSTLRMVAKTTGLWRMSSSTARGASSGRSANSAHCSGWSHKSDCDRRRPGDRVDLRDHGSYND
jgi:hypothetical protein